MWRCSYGRSGAVTMAILPRPALPADAMRSASIWFRVFTSARRCSSGGGDCSAAVSKRVLMAARSMCSPFQNSAPSPSMEISILSALGCCTAAVAFGKSILIACVSRGAVIMKITSRTNITSINGIMLISDMGPGVPPRLKVPNAIIVLLQCANGWPAVRALKEDNDGIRCLQSRRRARSHVRDQHDPVDGREVGPARDLHDHRASAHARDQDRFAEGDRRRAAAQGRQDRDLHRRRGRAVLERRTLRSMLKNE